MSSFTNPKLIPLFLSVAIVQTIVIGYLFFEIELLNRAFKADSQTNAPSLKSADLDLFRQIMREELTRHSSNVQLFNPLEKTPKPDNPMLFSQVNQQLDLFIAQKEISTLNIELFYAQVASLNQKEKRALVRRLSDGISSGRIRVLN